MNTEQKAECWTRLVQFVRYGRHLGISPEMVDAITEFLTYIAHDVVEDSVTNSIFQQIAMAEKELAEKKVGK